ncbi:hypothetical protein VTH82DRAFT_8143 [Thermothelomyces myriococcoides]
MPPKSAAKAPTGVTDAKQPTAQEAFLFYSIIKNMKGKPEIDWAAVAADAGYKTAETAKVRYGQIKRKLGLDNWNNGKAKGPKDEEVIGDGVDAETPTSTRTKKSVTTPGTGAGVKKRASATKRTPGSRSRKAKSEAIIKMEDDADQDTVDEGDGDGGGDNNDHPDNDGDEHVRMDEMLETPTKKKTGGVGGKRTKAAGTGRKGNGTTAGPSVLDEYASFPTVLPEPVIEREAILVNNNGVWTVSPAPIDVHAQWLARLPASLQTRFYLQAHSATTTTATTTTTAGTVYNGHGNNITSESNTGHTGFMFSHAVTPAVAENEEEGHEEGEEKEKGMKKRKREEEEVYDANNSNDNNNHLTAIENQQQQQQQRPFPSLGSMARGLVAFCLFCSR